MGALSAGWRLVWNGPFYIGKLSPPVALGDAFLKVLEVLWRGGVMIAGSLALVVGGYAASEWVDDLRVGKPSTSDLKLLIEPFSKGCDREYPILVGIGNRSKVEVRKTYITIEARRPGRSTDLVRPSSASYTDDSIIKPGQASAMCWSMPEVEGLERGESVRSLVWTVRVASVEWAQD